MQKHIYLLQTTTISLQPPGSLRSDGKHIIGITIRNMVGYVISLMQMHLPRCPKMPSVLICFSGTRFKMHIHRWIHRKQRQIAESELSEWTEKHWSLLFFPLFLKIISSVLDSSLPAMSESKQMNSFTSSLSITVLQYTDAAEQFCLLEIAQHKHITNSCLGQNERV